MAMTDKKFFDPSLLSKTAEPPPLIIATAISSNPYMPDAPTQGGPAAFDIAYSTRQTDNPAARILQYSLPLPSTKDPFKKMDGAFINNAKSNNRSRQEMALDVYLEISKELIDNHKESRFVIGNNEPKPALTFSVLYDSHTDRFYNPNVCINTVCLEDDIVMHEALSSGKKVITETGNELSAFSMAHKKKTGAHISNRFCGVIPKMQNWIDATTYRIARDQGVQCLSTNPFPRKASRNIVPSTQMTDADNRIAPVTPSSNIALLNRIILGAFINNKADFVSNETMQVFAMLAEGEIKKQKQKNSDPADTRKNHGQIYPA